MKKHFFYLAILCFSILFAACSNEPETNEPEVQEKVTVAENLEYNPEFKPSCVLTTDADCGLPGGSITFTFNPNPPGSNVIWSIQSGDISAILGNGTTQTFNLGSNFSGGQIMAIGGAFDCKDTYIIDPCFQPSCAITGPNCGTAGDQVTFTFSGAGPGQGVNWSAFGSGITLISGQGTNSATFLLGPGFSGANIYASTNGIPLCSANFPLSDCCQSSNITITNDGVLEN
ncbi:MAG: hypothetical protein KTR22_12770 [Flavobacteriaceae bacterium]|nr:hypothetical protein [Flavobacteriaceae bacterium]